MYIEITFILDFCICNGLYVWFKWPEFVYQFKKREFISVENDVSPETDSRYIHSH